ncbi:MAG TPA: NAD-dependent epimerase/dehydratase family protein [Candidatus Acidoferrales bacterium]|nr:NAD-dependent epimerase/dehydratase family protein [Candidatus Acidoferrales bacterium]
MSLNDSLPRTCLITGGAGFIGSHLTELLLSQGCHVLALDDLSTGSLDNIRPFAQHPNYHFARAGIANKLVLDRLASQAAVIFHLAAAVGVKLIVDRPVHTVVTNVMGTEAVLRAALRYGCRVQVVSSSEVYGKGFKVPFSEDDDVLLGPTSKSRWSYASSKMVDEFLGLAYHREYGLEVIVSRLFNTVGPRQTGRYGMVIPRLVYQALRNEPLTVYGDGTQSRCFCDVRDVVDALVRLARHPQAPGRVLNVGGTEEVTIEDLARRIRTLAGSSSPIIHVPYEDVYSPGFEDMQRRVPDISRLQSLLGWRAQHSLDDCLKSVIEYERGRIAG